MTPTDLENARIKKIRSIAIIGIVSIIAIIFVAWYISNSWIRLSVDDKDVTLTIYQSTAKVKEVKASSLTAAIKPGSYTIVASKPDGSAEAKYVELSFGEIFTQHFTLHPAPKPTPVITQSVVDLSATSDRISFIDPQVNKGYMTISAGDGYQNVAPNTILDQIAWLSPEFGVATYLPAEENAVEPRIMTIENNTSAIISTPFSLQNTTYSVQPTGTKGIVAGVDNKVYRKASPETGFTEIYAAAHPVSVLYAKKHIVLFEQRGEKDEVLQGTLRVLTEEGKVVGSLEVSHIIDPSNVPRADISPDNTKLIITINGTAIIYDLNLKKLHQLPSPGIITSAKWSSDTTVIYLSHHSIWKYDLSTETADALGTENSTTQLHYLSVDTSTDQAFYEAVDTKNPPRIAKVSLSGKSLTPDTSMVNRLTTLLPYYVPVALCHADYLFLDKPTVLIVKQDENDARLNQENLQFCREEVDTYLKRQNVDVPSLHFITGSVAPDLYLR